MVCRTGLSAGSHWHLGRSEARCQTGRHRAGGLFVRQPERLPRSGRSDRRRGDELGERGAAVGLDAGASGRVEAGEGPAPRQAGSCPEAAARPAGATGLHNEGACCATRATLVHPP